MDIRLLKLSSNELKCLRISNDRSQISPYELDWGLVIISKITTTFWLSEVFFLDLGIVFLCSSLLEVCALQKEIIRSHLLHKRIGNGENCW